MMCHPPVEHRFRCVVGPMVSRRQALGGTRRKRVYSRLSSVSLMESITCRVVAARPRLSSEGWRGGQLPDEANPAEEASTEIGLGVDPAGEGTLARRPRYATPVSFTLGRRS